MTDAKKVLDGLGADFKRKVDDFNAKANLEAAKQAAKSRKALAKSAEKFKK